MSATLGEKLVTGDEEAPAVVAKPDDAPPTTSRRGRGVDGVRAHAIDATHPSQAWFDYLIPPCIRPCITMF